MWDILYLCGWKIIPSYPFMWDILYPCSWKIIPWSSIYVRYIVPLRLEIYTSVYSFMVRYLYCQSMNFNPIHPLTISYSSLKLLNHSSFKWLNPSAEFHKDLVRFHTPPIHSFRWISSYNRVKISTGPARKRGKMLLVNYEIKYLYLLIHYLKL